MFKRIMLVLICLTIGCSIPTSAFAMGHASGGHSSGGHSSGSHASGSHSAASHSAGSHASASHGIASHPSTEAGHTTSHPAAKAASRLPNTPSAQRAVNSATHTETYKSLRTSNERNSYTYYHGYYSTYHPNQTPNQIMAHHYYWMPMWLANSNNSESQSVKNAAKQNGLKWIEVSGNAIAVPNKIYRHVKRGDHITLIDDAHLRVNDHTYTI